MVSKSSDISPYQQFIHKSRYARWDQEKQRRENWDETVHRYVSFFAPRIPKADREATAVEIERAILHMDVMPSMRAMMTAALPSKKTTLLDITAPTLLLMIRVPSMKQCISRCAVLVLASLLSASTSIRCL